MCSIKSDGNGGHRILLSRSEWLKVFGLLLTASIVTVGLSGLFLDLKIKLAIATHSASQIHQAREKP